MIFFFFVVVGQLSQHIPGPTVCIFHFSCFSVFIILHVIQSLCLIFHGCLFVHHNSGPTVNICHISGF